MNFLSLTLFVIIIIIMCDDYDLVVGAVGSIPTTHLMLYGCIMNRPCSCRADAVANEFDKCVSKLLSLIDTIPMTRIKISPRHTDAHTQANVRADIVHWPKGFTVKWDILHSVSSEWNVWYALYIFYFKALCRKHSRITEFWVRLCEALHIYTGTCYVRCCVSYLPCESGLYYFHLLFSSILLFW